MKTPTEKQIEAGRKVATEMLVAHANYKLGSASGCKAFDINDYDFKEIVQMYINDEIESVAGIYMAMDSVK